MNSSRRKVRGVLPVLQTPYHADETIDLATLEKEVAWLYDCGADGIVMAMVSEVLRLSSAEREELAEAACKFGNSRGAVVISALPLFATVWSVATAATALVGGLG